MVAEEAHDPAERRRARRAHAGSAGRRATGAGRVRGPDEDGGTRAMVSQRRPGGARTSADAAAAAARRRTGGAVSGTDSDTDREAL